MAKDKPAPPLRCQPCTGTGRVWGPARRKVACRKCGGTGRVAGKVKS